MMNDFKLYTPFLHFHLLVGIFVVIELGATFAYICFGLVSISYSLGRTLVLSDESIIQREGRWSNFITMGLLESQ
jgi:hypothetical protein